jgi:hypothetical protein
MTDEKMMIFEMLERTARLMRVGDEGSAASQLNLVLTEIGTVLKRKTVDDVLMNKLLYSMETMHLLQQSQDWVALADVIEYEFIMLWRKIET